MGLLRYSSRLRNVRAHRGSQRVNRGRQPGTMRYDVVVMTWNRLVDAELTQWPYHKHFQWRSHTRLLSLK